MTDLTDFLFDQETVERNYREYVFHQGEIQGEARGEARGIAIGEANGIKIATLNNIKSLLKVNVDPATIMQAFNLSEIELESIRQEMLTE